MAINVDDTPKLKPSECFLALRHLIRVYKAAMVIGPPGCSKSSLIVQAAEAEGFDVISTHPVLDDPSDWKGLGWKVDDEHAEFLPFGFINRILNAKKPTVVRIEDLGQASPAVQAATMTPVLDRMIAGKPIPEHVTFVASTNRRTDKAGVSGILEPVKGRFTLLHVRSDVNDFCANLIDRGQSEYGLTEQQILAGHAFLKMCPDLVNKFEATADMTNSPTERNWVEALSFVNSGLPFHVEQQLIAGRVGSGCAVQFTGFLKIMSGMVTIESILMNPEKVDLPEETSALWVTAVGLATKMNPKNCNAAFKYLERLRAAGYGDFAVKAVQDATLKDPNICNTRAYIDMSSGPLGKLIRGEV